MIIRSAELETVVGVTTARLPVNTLPEIAFAGRSNVGKSSLINALVQRKALARTSSQPGKTQTLNFYRVNDSFYLVDLPGYGYANVPEAEKARWGRMIERYLTASKQLKGIFLLMDVRHAPSANDRQMFAWTKANGFAPVVIATKADKVGKKQLQENLETMRTVLDASPDVRILPFSAQTKEGREEIYSVLEEMLS